MWCSSPFQKRKGRGTKMKDDGLLVMTASPFFWPISAVYYSPRRWRAWDPRPRRKRRSSAGYLLRGGFIFFAKFSPLFGEYSHFDSHVSKELNHQLVLVVFKSSEWFYFEAKLFAFLGQSCKMIPIISRQDSRSLTIFSPFSRAKKNGKAAAKGRWCYARVGCEIRSFGKNVNPNSGSWNIFTIPETNIAPVRKLS